MVAEDAGSAEVAVGAVMTDMVEGPGGAGAAVVAVASGAGVSVSRRWRRPRRRGIDGTLGWGLGGIEIGF